MPRPKLYKTKHPNLKRTTKAKRDGKTHYYGDIRIAGKRFRPPFGPVEEEAALAELAEFIRRKRLELLGTIGGPVFLGEALAAYTDHHAPQVRKATLEAWSAADKALLEWFPETFLHKIDEVELGRRLNERLAKRSAASANAVLKRIRQVVRWYMRLGKVDHDPTVHLKRFREPEPRIRCLSAEEEAKLYQVAPDWFIRMVRFAILTGFRFNEQASLRWEWVGASAIKLPGSLTKSHKGRSLPIMPGVRDILETQRPLAQNGLVFPTERGCVWNRGNFRHRYWRPLFTEAGISEEFVWHDLRHTFCSRLVQRGARLYTVCKLAGHSDMKITMRYAHLAPHNLEETLLLLEP